MTGRQASKKRRGGRRKTHPLVSGLWQKWSVGKGETFASRRGPRRDLRTVEGVFALMSCGADTTAQTSSR